MPCTGTRAMKKNNTPSDAPFLVFLRTMARMVQKGELNPENGIALAVSGGSDSMALAAMFAKTITFSASQNCLQRVSRPPEWHLIFVQHHLRGEESLRDEAFLRESKELWSRYPNPPVSIQVLDGVPEGGWSPGAFEALARSIRYQKLFEFAKKMGIKTLATAHTRDDQAETVLFRLMRGTGISGLRAIRGNIPAKGTRPQIIRPLLKLEKKSLQEWMATEGIPWQEDSSNQSLTPDRNYLRHLVLPLLIERWGKERVLRGLCRLSREATTISKSAEKHWDKEISWMELPKAGNRVVWQSAKAKIKRRKDLAHCLHRLWQREGWPAKEWSRERFIRLAKWIQGKGPLEALPNGWRLFLDEHILRFDPPEQWFNPEGNSPP